MTTNSKYKRGAIYERKTRQILEEQFNCFWTARSAGSKSCIDTFGISKDEIYLIQVKSTKKLKERIPSKAELEDLQNLAENPFITALMFIFVRGKLRIYNKYGGLLRKE